MDMRKASGWASQELERNHGKAPPSPASKLLPGRHAEGRPATRKQEQKESQLGRYTYTPTSTSRDVETVTSYYV